VHLCLSFVFAFRLTARRQVCCALLCMDKGEDADSSLKLFFRSNAMRTNSATYHHLTSIQMIKIDVE
jgi:hypothetical protein